MTDSPFVALYLRKSRDKEELADPDFLHKHRREGLRWAADRNFTIAPEHIFEEQGSGDQLRSRPACRALLETISRLPRGAGGYLWTTEPSRLTRGSLADRGRIYEVFTRAHIKHVTRSAEYDLNQADQLMQWEILTTIARHELGQYKQRVEAARLEMALEARLPTGRPPFGWWWDRNHKNPDGSKGKAQTDPVAFAIVQALCRDVYALSTHKLAAKYQMNQKTVLDLLRNPFLCGRPHRRHFPHHGERCRRDNGEPWKQATQEVASHLWIEPLQAGNYEPACTIEEFAAIQQVLTDRRETKAPTAAADGWCRALVQFVGHDRRARLGVKNRGGKNLPVYELSAPRGTNLVYIARHVVNEAVDAAMSALLTEPRFLRAAFAGYEQQRAEPREPRDDQAVRAEIATIERRLDVLLRRELDAADAGDREEVASIARERGEYKQRLVAVRAALAGMAAAQTADPEIDLLLQHLPALSTHGAAIWRACEVEERVLIANALIAQVRCRAEAAAGQRAWYRGVEEVRFKPRFARRSENS